MNRSFDAQGRGSGRGSQRHRAGFFQGRCHGAGRAFAASLLAATALVFACVLVVRAETMRQAPAPASLQATLDAVGNTPEALFVHVRDRIRPRLGHRLLQGPLEVLGSGEGNAAERTRLLAALLEAAGHPVRFAAGELDEDRAATLIGQALPATGEAKVWPDAVPLSQPQDDPALIAAVRRHTWVQVLRDGRWVDLDPAFSDAAPGVRHAELQSSFYRFSPGRLPRLELTLEYDRSATPGEYQELVWWDGPLEAVAGEALALRIHPRITTGAGGDGDLDPARRLVDPLAGADEEPAAVSTVTVWHAELFNGERALAVGVLPAVSAAEPGLPRSLRLRSRIVFDEEDAIEDVRLLADADAAGHLPLFQRHALLYTGGRLPASRLESWPSVQPPAQREALRAGLETLRKEAAAGAQGVTPAALDTALGLELATGRHSAHLLNLVHATVADRMSDDLARRLGVVAWFDEPRLLVGSLVVGADGRRQQVLDLRRDRMTAVARPGQPRRVAESFQFGRGVMSSALEGRVLGAATGSPALTTALLMRQARDEGTATRLLSVRERDQLATLALPEPVQARVEAALDSGKLVMLPARPVSYQGEPRWGWWQIDPRSYHTVGVLDSGLHQAVVERTLIETEGVLSDEMAAVIGAISGATDTQFAISAMVLKHGELTAEALAEAKAYMSNLGEALCQALTVEAKVGHVETLASVAVEMEGCFRYEASAEIGAEAGGSLTIMDEGWCEAFQRGFTCAAMTLLNAYRNEQ